MRIVLDTNVLIAGLLSAHGAPAQLLDLALAAEDVVVLLDDRIMAEYVEVARRPKFGLSAVDVARVLDALATVGEHIVARPLSVTLPDRDDLPFLEIAAAGDADALVTGNGRHFTPKRGRHAVRVCTPRELLDALRERR
ncbi:MAG TPA: putative toxin-antitoxin system toxin component, PIN family [Gemmatimonadaceae bacterium]|nr:putative toxin-antitoxin system toxin component, PIN family [Gemmatimonadaceae bacterium]